MDYETRIIAFIDLLGFKKLVKEKSCDYIKEGLDILRNFTSDEISVGEEKRKTTKTREITQFSDSIVLSAACDEQSAVFNTLYDLQLTVAQLLHYGFLCRGGVTIGNLIHTKDYLYGSAMIDAYMLECKKAQYPRIVVDERLLPIAGQHHAMHHSPEQEEDFVKEIISKDDDGCYYIDYFGKVQSELESCDHSFQYLGHIEKAIKSLEGDPVLLGKRDWLVGKYNALLDELKNSRNAFYYLDGHSSANQVFQTKLNGKNKIV